MRMVPFIGMSGCVLQSDSALGKTTTVEPDSDSLTLRAKAFGENGLWRNWTEEDSTPHWWITGSRRAGTLSDATVAPGPLNSRQLIMDMMKSVNSRWITPAYASGLTERCPPVGSNWGCRKASPTIRGRAVSSGSSGGARSASGSLNEDRSGSHWEFISGKVLKKVV